jgi:hypothetical protein
MTKKQIGQLLFMVPFGLICLAAVVLLIATCWPIAVCLAAMILGLYLMENSNS